MVTLFQKAEFEREMHSLEMQIANVTTHLNIDATVRRQYNERIRAMRSDLENRVQRGKIGWKQAAEEACDTRNNILKFMRKESTAVGEAISVKLKPNPPPLNQVIAKKTLDLFGANADFNLLSEVQKNQIYKAVVGSSGKSREWVTTAMRRLTPAARGLIAISVAVSVYNVATAEDKVNAAGREFVTAGASIAGGIAGGAMAGLACGPGAPVCVTVGAFVGGVLAAYGFDVLWSW